jgi:hypothetical protein
MNKVEVSELSKIKSVDNCCLFCQSKCSKCGSVDIEVKYQRIYNFDDEEVIFNRSDAYVFCHECGNHNESYNTNDFSESGFADDNEIAFNMSSNNEYTYREDITTHLDSFFNDEEPIPIDLELMETINDQLIEEFVLVYEYQNVLRNKIALSLDKWYCIIGDHEDYIDDETSEELYCLFDIPDVLLECSEKPDEGKSHYVVKSTAWRNEL